MGTFKQARADLATLLYALSFATGLGFGGHMEHGLGSAALGLQLADTLDLSEAEREAIFYGALLKDVACTACSAGIAAFFPDDEQVSLADVILLDPSSLGDMLGWLSKYLRLDAQFPKRIARLLSFLAQCAPLVRETMRSHCEIAELFARQLGFPDTTQQALRFQWERWDGKGMAYGLKGEAIPRAARLLHLAQVLDLVQRLGGPEAACALAREKRGSRFDPQGVDAFLTLSRQPDFWSTLEAHAQKDALLARRPATRAELAYEGQAERICEVLADFVDLKTRETWHHSRTVALVAEDIGRCLHLSALEMTTLRCAALVHDIGKVAVPIAILLKGEDCSPGEWEAYRLHPYHTQRILEQVEALQDLAPAASAHHEWMNGQGYHRQLSGTQIPLHGRILAVANTYVRLAQQQPEQQQASVDVLSKMRPLVGLQFDDVCYQALVTSLTGLDTSKGSARRVRKVGNLSEREVEVLCLLAQGNHTPQIARALNISRKTVEHHLTHIYNKIGVTCQTAAVVYAVQHGLV
jgi:HD-GYP domain-containing protein (c-di-GMP phosphodiesterase class II)